MRLYHFTSLFHLPDILREGITKGDFPVALSRSLDAPNLTANGNPRAQLWVRGSAVDKTKVRLTLETEDDDPQLRSWHRLCKQYKADRAWKKRLDPTGQGRHWYGHFGIVSRRNIRCVEVLDGDEYHVLDGPDLEQLITRIDEEKTKIQTVPTYVPNLNRICDFVALRPGVSDSWLLDGPDEDQSLLPKLLGLTRPTP